jgi:hypothetical protein
MKSDFAKGDLNSIERKVKFITKFATRFEIPELVGPMVEDTEAKLTNWKR